jgi:glycerol-3-phosphate dehydrogenase
MGGVIARDPETAARTSWDLVVVGGGVYGVGVALEAARRGLRPLLLERGDFGGETTWNSLRIVHGGLRYLQSLDLPRFRESVRERRWFLRHFPDRVEPLPCLMPLYGEGARRPSILAAALAANHLLSATKNLGVRGDRKLPWGGIASAAEVRRIFPGARPDGLRGGAIWFDAVMPDSERLLVEMLRAACDLGASALNRMEAVSIRVRGERAVGVVARDAETGIERSFDAPVVVNCAGPWAREFGDIPDLFHPSLAFNLLFDRPPVSTHAVAVAPPNPGARTYFVTGWKGRLFAGTYHHGCDPSVRTASPSESQIDRFVADLNAAIPGFDLRRGEILRVHAGLLPARRPGSDALAVRETIHDHGAAGGLRGLHSVSGVKWTTARLVGAKTVDRIFPGRRALPFSRSPGPPPPSWREFRDLAARDRSAARAVVEAIVRRESVRTPEDLVLRRTGWGSVPSDALEAEALVLELLGPGAFAGAMR